jgi:uncharacterized protein YndB with AHSA1/START domain
MKNTEDPIIVSQNFNTSIVELWNAITELDQMKQWFFNNIKTFKAEVGFETQFLVQLEDRKFTHLWKLTEVIPFEKITYLWQYAEYPGVGIVTFNLTDNKEYVTLKLVSTVTEDFPDEIPEFKRESGVMGWNYFIKLALKEYIDSKS